MQRREDEQRLAGQRLAERLRACPEKSACTPGGQAELRLRRASDGLRPRCPSDAPGAMLNESVTEGNWPWWLMASGAVRLRELRERRERHRARRSAMRT